ncbi:hypothetical protein SHIRM173S_13034 [Streptomyces hirsutus]
MFAKRAARSVSGSSSGPRAASRTPLRSTRSPSPDGRPEWWALAVRCDKSPATGPQHSDWAASTGSGPPAARQASATSETGCAVRISWLADWRAGQRGVRPQRPGEGVRSHGPRAVHPDLGDRTAQGFVDFSRVEYRRVFDRRHDQVTPDAPPPGQRTLDPGMHRPGAGRGERLSSGRHSTASAAASRAASSSSRALLPSR